MSVLIQVTRPRSSRCLLAGTIGEEVGCRGSLGARGDVSVYIYTYTEGEGVHVDIYMYTYICISIYAYTYMYIYVHIWKFECVYICTSVADMRAKANGSTFLTSGSIFLTCLGAKTDGGPGYLPLAPAL